MSEMVDRRRGNIALVIRRPDAEDCRLRPIILRFDVKLPSATDVDVRRIPWTIIPYEDEGRRTIILDEDEDAYCGILNKLRRLGKYPVNFYECAFPLGWLSVIYAGFDFKDFGLIDKEEYPNAMLILDETSSIIVPEIISVHVGFDFKDFGLTDKEEYPNAMCFPDKTVQKIISTKAHHYHQGFHVLDMEEHLDVSPYFKETRSKVVGEFMSMVMDCGPNSKDFILIKAKECCMDRPFLNKTSFILVSEPVRIPPSGGNEQLVEPMIALSIGFEGPSTLAAESSYVDTVVNNVIFLDSAAGRHMVSHAALLSNPRDPPSGMDRVRTADGSLLPVIGYGDIQMEALDIREVCLVRGLEVNLISVGQLASSHNICSCFFGDQCNLMLSDGRLIGGAFRRNDNQYILRFLEIP